MKSQLKNNELIYKRLRPIRLLAIGFKLEAHNNRERMISEPAVVDSFGMLFSQLPTLEGVG